MKLLTTIKPRRDGTVRVAGKDGKTVHVFTPNEHGDLVCDIGDEATVARLLSLTSEDFQPADREDYARARALLQSTADDDADDDDPDGDPDDDPVDPNAPPIEASTPPPPAAPLVPEAAPPAATPIEASTPPASFKAPKKPKA